MGFRAVLRLSQKGLTTDHRRVGNESRSVAVTAQHRLHCLSLAVSDAAEIPFGGFPCSDSLVHIRHDDPRVNPDAAQQFESAWRAGPEDESPTLESPPSSVRRVGSVCACLRNEIRALRFRRSHVTTRRRRASFLKLAKKERGESSTRASTEGRIPRQEHRAEVKTLERGTKRLQSWCLRRFFLFWLTVCCTLRSGTAWAQVPSAEMNNAPPPVANSRYSLLRQALDADQQWLRARLDYLHRPLVVTVASTDPAGRSAALVAGSVLLDVAMGTTLARDFDLGVALGGHLASWGSGEALVTGTESSRGAVGARDTRLEGGYSWRWRDIRIRPFAALTLPTGDEGNFAGRATPSGEVGGVWDWEGGTLSAVAELSFIVVPSQPADAIPWGHQLRAGLGTRVQLIPAVYLTLEALLQPVVGTLPEDSLRPFPAEVLLSTGWQMGELRLQAAWGLGLPLSRLPPTAANHSPMALAPGSPEFRSSVQLNWAWSPPR